MGEGLQRHRTGARKQLTKGGVPGEIRSQRNRVHEGPDQILRLPSSAVGNHRTNDEVFHSGVPMEQSLEGGERCHEQRDTIPVAEGLDRLREFL